MSLSTFTSFPAAVEVVKVDDRKGYRFDGSAAKLFGVPASLVTTRCSRFPSEFSVVVTFRKESARAGNEYLLSLLAPDRQTILLGVRLQRDKLYFDFVGEEPRERVTTAFDDARLADGRWHTVVIAVAGKSLAFSLDCIDADRHPDLRFMELPQPFPTRLVTKNARFHVGNRRRTRNRFTGIVSQVQLVPGADASVSMCSKTPHSFLPEWVMSAFYPTPSESGRNGVAYLSKGEDSRVVPCSAGNKGQLVYREAKGDLQMCDSGNKWTRLATTQEKLDYVIDYADLSTKSKSLDVEVFRIPNEGLFLASANQGRDRNMNSTVYKWRDSGGGFVPYQNITTDNARNWKFFSIENEHFLAVANNGAADSKPAAASTVYRWMRKRRNFVPHQYLRTLSARSFDAFEIDGKHFLAVANYARKSDHKTRSWVYMWDSDHRAFIKHQPLESVGAYDVEYFRIGTDHFLALANCFNGLTSSLHSVVYRWRMSTFVPHQYIETTGATDWEHFQIDGRHYLAVANFYDQEEKTYEVNSMVFEFLEDRKQFVKLQEIPTHGARDFEFFTVGRDSFLIAASSSDSNEKLNTVIYRWQGMEHFVPTHSFPVHPCSDWESFRDDHGEHFLVSAMSANVKPRNSKVLKILTY